MILQTSTCVNLFGNTVTQTYISYGGSYYCHSCTGSETLVFPAKKSGNTYVRSSSHEILDFSLCEEISRIAQRN